ncbi:hypothetical protein FACS1894184_03600 [Clostridia bacterium]|nr:hypothetical protein FACS1894184_03600 [Clostridia bacterium]
MSLVVLVVGNSGVGLPYMPTIDFNDPAVKRFFVLIAPIMIASIVGELNKIIDRNMASSLDSGTISMLNYASKVNSVFVAFIGTAISTAIYPQMTENAASGIGIKKDIGNGIRLILPIVVPLMLGMAFLSEPMIRVLFERGKFTREYTMLTADVFRYYAPGMLALNLNGILMRGFHSRQKTKTPAIVSTVSLCINIVLNLMLIRFLGARGLAIATSIAGFVTTILLYVYLHRDIGAIPVYSPKEYLKLLLATVAMSVMVTIGIRVLPMMDVSYLTCIIWLAIIVMASVTIYAAVLIITKSEVAHMVIELVKGILGKKKRNSS